MPDKNERDLLQSQYWKKWQCAFSLIFLHVKCILLADLCFMRLKAYTISGGGCGGGVSDGSVGGSKPFKKK